jgi:hypothetical protein
MNQSCACPMSKIPFAFRLILVLFSLFFSTQLFSLQYGICAKSENSKQITKLFVISERCSGSNYINNLVLKNFEVQDERLGQKHFPPWYDLPEMMYRGNSQYYTFAGTEDFLFIIIFRNPYDWVRSIHQKPFHAHSSLVNVSFSKFIRTPWKLSSYDKTAQKQQRLNHLVDRNPLNGSHFDNVLKLRTAKIKNMLQILDRAPNVYYINYEIVRDHPQEVLQEIKSLFRIAAKPSYTPVTTYKGRENKGEYKPKVYKPLSQKDLNYINSQLDPSIEAQIGYSLIGDATQIDKK